MNNFGRGIYVLSPIIFLFRVFLEIKVLKEIIEKVPDDYEINFTSGKNIFKLSDKFEIDVSQKNHIPKILNFP